MTIYYKTTKLTKALDYIRIHLGDGYTVSAYKSGIDYIVKVSGLEGGKDEPQTEEWQDWKDRMWSEAIVTEPNSSEKPNNCETCKHKHFGTMGYCKTCGESNYEPKDEPQADCPWK